jgi:hypothetical protein
VCLWEGGRGCWADCLLSRVSSCMQSQFPAPHYSGSQPVCVPGTCCCSCCCCCCRCCCCCHQVCGGYTDQMAQLAQLLDEQLGDNIDFVDINCGECSSAGWGSGRGIGCTAAAAYICLGMSMAAARWWQHTAHMPLGDTRLQGFSGGLLDALPVCVGRSTQCMVASFVHCASVLSIVCCYYPLSLQAAPSTSSAARAPAAHCCSSHDGWRRW